MDSKVLPLHTLFLKSAISRKVLEKFDEPLKNKFLQFMNEESVKRFIAIDPSRYVLLFDGNHGTYYIEFWLDHSTFVFDNIIDEVEGIILELKATFRRNIRDNNFLEFINCFDFDESQDQQGVSPLDRFLAFSRDYMDEEKHKLDDLVRYWKPIFITEANFESKQKFILKFNRQFNEKSCSRTHFKLVSPAGVEEQGLLVHVVKEENGVYSLSPSNDTHFPENLTNIAGFNLVPEIERQKRELMRKINAFKKLNEDNRKYPDIWSIIKSPEALVSKSVIPEVEFFNQQLSPDIQSSIRSILKEDLIHVVQGPPGTGKTTLITELCAQLISQGKNIIVAAQNNLAIDNVIEKLKKMSQKEISGARVVRLGDEDSLRLALASDFLTRERSRELSKETQSKVVSLLKILEKVGDRQLPNDLKSTLKKIKDIQSFIDLYNSQIEKLESLIQREQDFKDEMAKIQLNNSLLMMTGFMFREKVTERVYSCLRNIYRDLEIRKEYQEESVSNLVSLISNKPMRPSEHFDFDMDETEKRALFVLETKFTFKDICAFVDRFDTDDFLELMKNLERLAGLDEKLKGHQQELEKLIPQKLECESKKYELEKSVSVFSEIGSPEEVACFQVENFSQIYAPYVKALMELQYEILRDLSHLDAYVIGSASVVFSTCSQLAGRSMASANRMFDVAIVDEASKAQIGELLIPMMMSQRFVFVGDHKQLPPVIDAKGDRKDVLVKTFFERMYETLPSTFKTQLKFQYRMPPQISQAISYFYDSPLQDADKIRDFNYKPYENDVAFHWIKTDGDVLGEVSYYNPKEIEETMHLLKILAFKYPHESIGVISAYRRHHEEVHKAFAKLRSGDPLKAALDQGRIELGTIDEFQGRQKDIIIINTVRSGTNLGHMEEKQRINVAFSRCEKLLYLVGHSNLTDNPVFKALIRRLMNFKKKGSDVA